MKLDVMELDQSSYGMLYVDGNISWKGYERAPYIHKRFIDFQLSRIGGVMFNAHGIFIDTICDQSEFDSFMESLNVFAEACQWPIHCCISVSRKVKTFYIDSEMDNSEIKEETE